MTKFKKIIFPISLFLILAGVVVFSFYPQIAPYILSIGVAMYGAIVFTTPYPGKSMRGKRLFNMQIFSVLLMSAACYLMFIGYNTWVILLLIAALFMAYSVQMTANIWKKEQAENNEK